MGSTSAHLPLLLVGVHLLHLPLVLVLLHMPLGIGVRLQTTTLSGENVNVDVRDDRSDDVVDYAYFFLLCLLNADVSDGGDIVTYCTFYAYYAYFFLLRLLCRCF